MTPKFEYQGKFYELKEPSIELWNKLMSMKDWTDEVEFSIKLISELCNLTEDEVKNTDWQQMLELSKSLSNYILQDSKKFYKEFEFEGQKYKFIDLPNLTFGEFVDIDTFLSKPANERLKDTHLLMAMFYREVAITGKLVSYDSSQLEKRAEKFKKLPVKYVNGSSTFFLLTEKVLRQSSPTSSKRGMWTIKTMIRILMTLPRSLSFGVGLIRSSNSRTKTLQKLKQSLTIR
jgi:hypothetical protein